MPLGQRNALQPYFGAGLAVNSWRYSESGEFIDFGRNREIFRELVRVAAEHGWGETPLLITEGGGRRLNGELTVRKPSAELLRRLGARE